MCVCACSIYTIGSGREMLYVHTHESTRPIATGLRPCVSPHTFDHSNKNRLTFDLYSNTNCTFCIPVSYWLPKRITWQLPIVCDSFKCMAFKCLLALCLQEIIVFIFYSAGQTIMHMPLITGKYVVMD